jgi:hypothetical protein
MSSSRTQVWTAAVLMLAGASAQAVDITAVTAQQNRVEGQSVEITATLNWGGLLISNPLIKVTRTVQATITPAPVATPAIPTQITLTFDSATARYRGQFNNLPFHRYTATVTATQTIRNYTNFPSTISTAQDTAPAQFNVVAPAGCFSFNQGATLQGWTVGGPFDGDTSNNLAQGVLVPQWLSSAGFLSPGATDADGALVLPVPETVFPDNSNLFASGFYRLDFASPGLGANAAWQGINGVSFRLSHNLSGIQVQPIVQARRPDGTTTFFRPVDANGAPIFQSVACQSYRAVVSNIAVPPDHTILGVRLRVFGPAGSVFGNESLIFIDGVCPRD